MVDYRFNIGEFVILSVPRIWSSPVKELQGKFIHCRPQVRIGRIINRNRDDCTAGTQIHYKVRWLCCLGVLHESVYHQYPIDLVDHMEFELELFNTSVLNKEIEDTINALKEFKALAHDEYSDFNDTQDDLREKQIEAKNSGNSELVDSLKKQIADNNRKYYRLNKPLW